MPVKEWIFWQGKGKQAKIQILPSSMTLHTLLCWHGQIVRSGTEGLAQIKGMPSHLRSWIQCMCLQVLRSAPKVRAFLPQGPD